MTDAFRQDLRHAARSLRRTPGFTGAAVLTLAVGIGATLAVFSVVDAVLLEPLPYGTPDRIVAVRNRWDGTERGPISPAEYFDYARGISAFDQFGVFRGGTLTVTYDNGDPERLPAGFMTYGVLPALGVTPAIGTAFDPNDDAPGSEDKVLISDSLWKRRFSASRDILGKRVVLDGVPHVVTGVMPPTFRLPDEFASREPAQLFVPLKFPPQVARARGSHFLNGVARLRSGMSVEAASAQIATMVAEFTRTMPGEYPPRTHFGARVTPLQMDVTGTTRLPLWILLGAVVCVLIVACTNVANLFLSRTEFRRREVGIRAALGASPRRILAYGVSEPMLVAIASGVCGVALAALGIRVLPMLQPADLPRINGVAFDASLLAFALLLGILAALLVGVVPAIRAARVAPQSELTGTRPVASVTRQGLRHALVGAQIGLTVALLLGAALLTTSFRRLLLVDPGYRTDHVVAVDVNLSAAAYREGERIAQFYDRVLGDLRRQAGVAAVGGVANLPLATAGGDLNIQIAGRETPRGTPSRRADWQVVTPGYFDALQIPLTAGRTIDSTDRVDTPGVVVINQTMAREYWPGADPLGARFTLGGGAEPNTVTVVGVVGDVRHNTLADEPARQMYFAQSQFRFWGGAKQPVRSLTLVARTTQEPAVLAGIVRATIRAIDPAVPIGAMRTMDDVRADSVSRPRFVTLLLSIFSATALLVALVGIYGVVAYSVAQRRRELGVRLALGATSSKVVRLVLAQGMKPVAVGIVAGLGGGLAISGVLQSMLFQISPRDPDVATAVAASITAVAALACYLPARRAALADPLITLRSE
jgi:putative ABC transport system permease protein